jgi:hypothetical protein
MANDGGTTAKIEQAMVDAAAALKIFKTADVWLYQISADAGGMEAFDKFAPFFFAKYVPATDSSREGDGDLNQHYRFGALIGQTSKERGVARIGNANNLGISKLRDLVIDLFDGWHPGEGFDCDVFYYDGEELELETPNKYALIIYFKANRITN